MSVEWAAGFFEGEGNARIMWHRRTKGDKYRRLCLTIAQVDRAALDKFLVCVGTGKIRGPYGPYSGNRQPHYQYMVYGKEALSVAKRLEPLLCGKRMQVRAAIQEYEEYLSDKA